MVSYLGVWEHGVAVTCARSRSRAHRSVLLVFLLLPMLSGIALAAEQFPPPDFESGYKQPQPATPPARAPLLEYLDVVVLAAALGLSSYLVFKKRSRRAIAALSIFSLAYFGFYRQGCVCAIGSIQNVAMGLVTSGYHVPLTVIGFFLLPLLFALFFGRTFCAAVCPHGAIQDLVLIRPLRVPAWLEHTLGLLAYIYLGAAVMFAATGSAFILCEYDPFIALFRLTGSFEMVTLGICILVIALFVGRPYCRYFCPYGVLLGLLSRVAKHCVTIYPDKCINCRLCEDSCPYGAIREPTSEAPSGNRLAGKRTLVQLIALLPVLIALFAWLGVRMSPSFARSNATVRVAERVWMEETGKARGTTEASDAFHHTGQPSKKLYEEALQIRSRFRMAGGLFGVWMGLVLGLKLIALSVRRRRVEYEADRAACVACGRCYPYCPEEHVRLQALEEILAKEGGG